MYECKKMAELRGQRQDTVAGECAYCPHFEPKPIAPATLATP